MKRKIIQATAAFFCILTVLINSKSAPGQEAELKPYDLDGTEWEINTALNSEAGVSKTGTDKLIFKDKKFIPESFINRGYTPTNYTISLKGSRTVCETMQSKEDENAFWRIEVLDEASIRGVYSIMTKKKNKTVSEDYSLNGRLINGTLVRQGERKPEPEVTLPPAEAPGEEVVEGTPTAGEIPAENIKEPEVEETETEGAGAIESKKHWWE